MDMPATVKPRKGRGAASNDSGRFEARSGSPSTTAGASPDEEPPPLATTADASTRRARSSPATTRRISASTARSTRIAAASTAASIAMRGRATPISACRPVSISRPASSTSRRPRRCSRRNCARRGIPAGRSRSAATPTPTSRPSGGSGSRASILEVLRDFRHPVTIVTKVGADPARHRHPRRDGAATSLRVVTVSVTTLDRDLARRMEPRAATPERRLETIAALAEAGDPDRGSGGADDPGAQRQRDGGDPRTGARGRARRRRLHAAAPAARTEGAVQGMARGARAATRPRTCSRWWRNAMAAGFTTRPGRSG